MTQAQKMNEALKREVIAKLKADGFEVIGCARLRLASLLALSNTACKNNNQLFFLR